MKIHQVSIYNFKVFKEIENLNLSSPTFLVGANGSGKSTFFDVFGFLRDLVRFDLRVALNKRGGFDQVVSRGTEELFSISVQVVGEINGKTRPVLYIVGIDQDSEGPFIRGEQLMYMRRRGKKGPDMGSLFDFEFGKGEVVVNEEDWDKEGAELKKEEINLESRETSALKGLGSFKQYSAATAVRKLIENWEISDFRIDHARPSVEEGIADHLSRTGDNLALVARNLFERHPERFASILEKMKQRIPGIEKVEAVTTVDGRVLLKFQDGNFKDPFMARHVSDGTLKMFAYLVLLNDPEPHPLLSIEEPENQLYPTLLPELVEELRDYANRGGQVLVSTHSPDLLNAAKPEEVLWLVKENGFTTIKKASEDPVIMKLYEEGDKLGWLWSQGYFTGSDPR